MEVFSGFLVIFRDFGGIFRVLYRLFTDFEEFIQDFRRLFRVFFEAYESYASKNIPRYEVFWSFWVTPLG